MMLAAIRRAIVGLSMLSAFSTTTMASPLPGGRPRPTATIAPPTTPAPTLAPPATPAPSLTPYPWEVLIPANSEKYLFGAASLIQNDLIVIASGYGLLHYDTKNASQTDYRVPSQPVWDVYGAAKNDIWAVGSQESAVGKVVRFDGTSWKDVNLGFNIQPRIILRAIHGTSSSNIWVTGGSGEDPTTGSSSKTGVVLFFNGRTWTKVLDVGTHYTGTAIFARGSDVWVGLVDGTLLHSSDGFKTRRIVARVGSGDDRGVYDIWGPSSSNTSDLYIGCNDGLKVVKNVGCVATGSTSCQQMIPLADAPDKGNTGYGVGAVVGGFPGLPQSVVYTAGTLGFGALWNGKLIQDKSIPTSNVDQSTYRSLMLAAPDAQGKSYMYAVANTAFLARRQV